MTKFSADDVTTVRASWLAGVYEAKNPDISAFTRHGGKLLLYHGFSDPGPGPRATIEYFPGSVAEDEAGQGATRLFLAPGMGHCKWWRWPRPALTGSVQLEGWVEKGTARRSCRLPGRIPVSAWKVCAYPQLPTGNADGTYSCK